MGYASVVVRHEGNVVNRFQGSPILALIYIQIIYFNFLCKVLFPVKKLR